MNFKTNEFRLSNINEFKYNTLNDFQKWNEILFYF